MFFDVMLQNVTRGSIYVAVFGAHTSGCSMHIQFPLPDATSTSLEGQAQHSRDGLEYVVMPLSLPLRRAHVWRHEADANAA